MIQIRQFSLPSTLQFYIFLVFNFIMFHVAKIASFFHSIAIIIVVIPRVNYVYTRTASVVQWSEFLPTDPRSGFNSRPYQIFWAVVGLERSPLSLMSTTEELLEKQ
jgi:hypothetical protein